MSSKRGTYQFSLSTRHFFVLGSCLFQFFEDLVRTHPACQQLLQHNLCFSLLCFFASRDATSFSAFFRAVFFSFRSAFKVSMFAVMDAISAVSASFADCFSAICVAKSAATVLGLFLLPFALGMVITSFLL